MLLCGFFKEIFLFRKLFQNDKIGEGDPTGDSVVGSTVGDMPLIILSVFLPVELKKSTVSNQ